MTFDINELKELCDAAGAAGLSAVSALAVTKLQELTDRCWRDSLGNVLAVRNGTDPQGKTVLLEAHLDEIGFLVTAIDELGFIHVSAAGGVDARVLASQAVQIFGDDVYTGIFCSVPPHLHKEEGKAPSIEDMGIDIGMTFEEARLHIPLGSRVLFAPNFQQLQKTVVSSKALDNRAGMAAILHCLRLIPQTAATVAVAFCVQEELGCRGAAAAARQLQPDMALVTDVSFAHINGEISRECGKLGKGPMIGISPILDEGISKCMQRLANEKAIPAQTEIMSGNTGTNADSISKENSGIPTGLLSIPLRYMHTPIEMADIGDIAAVGALMSAFIQEVGKNG